MPFIFQCPLSDCGKFLLLEDEVRSHDTTCLCCKRPIDVPVELESNEPPPPVASNPESTPRSSGKPVLLRNCPKCLEPITLTEEQRRRAVRCPHCEYWGILK